jgi:hypothetical protein
MTTTKPGEGREQHLHHVLTNLTEADAHVLFDTIAGQFGWTYSLWTRACAISSLHANTTPAGFVRDLTDEQWDRLTQTCTWSQRIHSTADRAVEENLLIQDAIVEAGLKCAKCGATLNEPPNQTGYLCDEHRTGPQGQPALIDPDTEVLYWHDGDTLMYAEPDPDNPPGQHTAKPYDWDDPDPDPMVHMRARAAETALALPTADDERNQA